MESRSTGGYWGSIQIDAGAGDDILRATSWSSINGGAGNDLMTGSNAFFSTGTGQDRVVVSGEHSTVSFEDLGVGDSAEGNGTRDYFSGYGGDGNDTFAAGDGEVFVGGARMATGFESINLYGGGGNDVFTSVGLSGLFDGGAGDDVIGVGGAGSSLGLEAYGGDGDDTLTGGSAIDHLAAGRGADHVYGGGGNDTVDFGYYYLEGGALDAGDYAEGGEGTDSLIAFTGAAADSLIFRNHDVLLGGVRVATGFESTQIGAMEGNDTFTFTGDNMPIEVSGGEGADAFRFSKGFASGAVRISDFDSGIDKLWLQYAGPGDPNAVTIDWQQYDPNFYGLRLRLSTGALVELSGVTELATGDVVYGDWA
ncbi:hypothetical protein Rumeso_02622 [Rubellimicrobium mesophilum DSM 19309]|uniref:Alkaline phosphatase n=1 Tax=Rubellimicrobium mesophilum DSM 19309 TaxID=442562 RepID=A0A017HNE4_9RHOB|nr:calcium-binding protein [Rubellimicrobium mesophilum]EYD75840.1 hypothetical protein Rumeso_02622 [Rubellimicrobium mesophilum DSM 19309]